MINFLKNGPRFVMVSDVTAKVQDAFFEEYCASIKQHGLVYSVGDRVREGFP